MEHRISSRRRSSHFAPNGRRSQWSCKLNGCVAWRPREGADPVQHGGRYADTRGVVTWVSFMRRVNLEAILYRVPELHVALSEGAVLIGKGRGAVVDNVENK